MNRLEQIEQNIWRISRHLTAASRYMTPYRLWNLGLVEYERITGKDRLRGLPYILIIDPLNVCNLKCPLCPTGTGNLPLKPGKMQLEQFKKLIDEIAPHTFKIMLYNWGEPFLHKEILEMILYAHDRRISTAISSNLNLLPPGGAEALVESGLDDLIVSCDGLTQEVYVKYRVNGKLERVVDNIRSIVEAKRKLKRSNPCIEFQFLVFKHNEHQVPDVKKFAYGLGVDYVRFGLPDVLQDLEDIRQASSPEFAKRQSSDSEQTQSSAVATLSPPEDIEARVAQNPPPIQCFWPWRSMVINWNGEIDPCCYNNPLDHFGNVYEQPFQEIWNGSVYQYARQWITGKVGQNEPKRIICRGCAGYNK